MSIQKFSILLESPTTISFEMQQNEQSKRAIEIFNMNPAFNVLPLPDSDLVQVLVNISLMGNSRVKYSPNSEFANEMQRFYFSDEAIAFLKTIRENRKGKLAGKNIGRIKTDFDFKTLYDWIIDARVRCIKSKSIKAKRDNSRILTEEIENLEYTKDVLIIEKQDLINEIASYEFALTHPTDI